MERNKKETKVDFSICRYIKNEMSYFTYNDFCENRIALKKLYNKMNNDEKCFYKWYVYANVNMTIKYKHAIWDYLNDYDMYGSKLMKLSKESK